MTESEAINYINHYAFRGVRYNVVRRPLSGGRGNIVMKKGSKNVPAETADEYYARLAQYIKDEPESYFQRWTVEITPEDIATFRRTCLDPILENVCDWYDSVVGRDPYPYDGGVTPMNWRHPFGVRNILDEGGSSDLDAYLADGSTVGLQRVTELFTELK